MSLATCTVKTGYHAGGTSTYVVMIGTLKKSGFEQSGAKHVVSFCLPYGKMPDYALIERIYATTEAPAVPWQRKES
jgi:hypothetical protein